MGFCKMEGLRCSTSFRVNLRQFDSIRFDSIRFVSSRLQSFCRLIAQRSLYIISLHRIGYFLHESQAHRCRSNVYRIRCCFAVSHALLGVSGGGNLEDNSASNSPHEFRQCSAHDPAIRYDRLSVGKRDGPHASFFRERPSAEVHFQSATLTSLPFIHDVP